MKAKAQNSTILGAGAAACAVCCAGPIAGFFAALGFGAVGAFLLFGGIAIVVAAVVIGAIVLRHRRKSRRDVGVITVAVDPPRVRLPS